MTENHKYYVSYPFVCCDCGFRPFQVFPLALFPKNCAHSDLSLSHSLFIPHVRSRFPTHPRHFTISFESRVSCLDVLFESPRGCFWETFAFAKSNKTQDSHPSFIYEAHLSKLFPNIPYPHSHTHASSFCPRRIPLTVKHHNITHDVSTRMSVTS